MAVPSVFLDFPAQPATHFYWREYNRTADLADWEWTYSGHAPPDALDAVDGGSMTLGSGDATSGSYLNGQAPSTIRLNRLNKTFWFLFTLSIDSATLCQKVFGLFDTNTNLLNTCIANGFGMYVNGPSGPTAGTWRVLVSNGAVTQYDDYQGYAGPAADTSVHTYAIRVQTDPTTLGTGSITWWQDSSQIGNGLSGAILTQSLLRPSIAMGNGSGVARSSTLYQDGGRAQR